MLRALATLVGQHGEMLRALLVVDVQQGFNDVKYWGPRNNPTCEANISAFDAGLARRWAADRAGRARFADAGITAGRGTGGNAVKPEVDGPVDLEVRKSVHSSFHGTPDLNTWLQEDMVGGIAICGITTNMCCETTARIGSDLGYDMWFVLDATAAFDLMDESGSTITAAQLARSTAAILSADFGVVIDTEMACALVSVASEV